jgi:hypothetical protein
MPRAATFALLIVLAAPAAGGARAAASTEDRYGPPRPAPAALTPPPTPAATVAEPATGWLSWSHKTAAAPVAVQSTPALPRVSAPAYAATPPQRPERVATAALPTNLYAPYPPSQSAVAPREPSNPAPWTSMGRAAQPTGAQQAQSRPQAPGTSVARSQAQTQTGQAPHFYSVHREFGLNPDPIPLPQQFFAGGSPDMAAAPPPLPPHPVPGTQAATSPANTAANRAREVELETADSAD